MKTGAPEHGQNLMVLSKTRKDEQQDVGGDPYKAYKGSILFVLVFDDWSFRLFFPIIGAIGGTGIRWYKYTCPKTQ